MEKPMHMQPTFSQPSEVLSQFDAMAERQALGQPVDAGAVWACATALATILRATMTPAPVKRSAPKSKALAFEMTAESLARALRLAMRACASRSRLPILADVRLDAAGDALLLTCNDLDREISVEVAAPGVGAWSAVVNAKALATLLSKAKGSVAMRGELSELRSSPAMHGLPAREWRDSILHLSGAVTATIEGRCVDDFPTPPPQVKPYKLLMQAAELRDLLAFVAPAMSEEETRYYLNGALLHVADGHLVAVATDGHRLHLAKMPAWHGLDFKGQIIPRATVEDMLAMLAAPVERFAFSVSQTGISLVAGPVSLVSKVVDASFPDYARVIPSKPREKITLEAAPLEAALAQAIAVKASARTARAFVDMAFGAGVLDVSAQSSEGASMAAQLGAPGCGHGYGLRFNAQYLREALKVTGGERVAFNIFSERDAVTITPSGGDGSRIVVLMPITR